MVQVRVARSLVASPLRVPTPEQSLEPLAGNSNDICPSIDPGRAKALIAPTHRDSDTVFHDPSTQSAIWMNRAAMVRVGKLDDSSVPVQSPLRSGSDGEPGVGGEVIGDGDGEGDEVPPPQVRVGSAPRTNDAVRRATFVDR
jgi:hypothetical protein